MPTSRLWLMFGLLSLAACTQRSLVGLAGDAALEQNDADVRPDAGEPVQRIDDCTTNNPAGLDARTVDALRAADDASELRWLYPYEGTVLPRGLSSPQLHWEGAVAQAAYVRLESSSFRYEGCVPVTANWLQLDERALRGVEAASEGSELLSLTLSLLAGDEVHGPLRRTLTLSSTRARGSISYQTYGSSLASATAVGSVMRVPVAGRAEPLLGNDSCSGCHGVSAAGDRLIASINGMGRSFALDRGKPGPASGPLTGLPGVEFAALAPTQRHYFATAHPVNASGVGLPSYGGNMQMASGLFTLDGLPVLDAAAPGAALMPAFGAEALFFNDFADGAGHALSVAPFDRDAVRFAAARRFFSDERRYPGWPAPLPDGRHVLFALGDSNKFGAEGSLLFGKAQTSVRSDLMLGDSQRGTSSVLWRSMGHDSAEDAAAGRSYLPFGDEEAHQAFYPTVMDGTPGEHWFVCFDAIRHHGSTGLKRAIWCAAIDTTGLGDDARDPSHPAFYLPGQEEATDNIRPVALRDTP